MAWVRFASPVLLDGGPEDVSGWMRGDHAHRRNVFRTINATCQQPLQQDRGFRCNPSNSPLREPRGESRHDSRPGATLRAAIKRRAAPFRRAVLGTGLAWFALASSAAFAAGAANPDATPSDTPEADLNIQAQPAGQWTGVWTRSTLLGDMGGVRSWLGKYGVTLQATEVSEYLDNVRGGLKNRRHLRRVDHSPPSASIPKRPSVGKAVRST